MKERKKKKVNYPTRVMIRMNNKMIEKLDQLAIEKGTTKSQIIRLLIEKYIMKDD